MRVITFSVQVNSDKSEACASHPSRKETSTGFLRLAPERFEGISKIPDPYSLRGFGTGASAPSRITRNIWSWI